MSIFWIVMIIWSIAGPIIIMPICAKIQCRSTAQVLFQICLCGPLCIAGLLLWMIWELLGDM